MVMVDQDSGEPIAYEVYEDEFFAQAFYSSMYDAEALKQKPIAAPGLKDKLKIQK